MDQRPQHKKEKVGDVLQHIYTGKTFPLGGGGAQQENQQMVS